MAPQRKYRIVGITGGIGSGKSTVGKLLSDRGFCVIDSDSIARELTSAGSPALAEIVERFGVDVLSPGGELDRVKMAAIVFSDSRKREVLERVLHPKIVEELHRRAVECGDRWVFALMPLLFEAGLEDSVDRIWLCYSPAEIRLERVMKRDGVLREAVWARMSSQKPDEEKIERSDAVIDTSETLGDVELQVNRALEELESGD